jgi:hypothetical protein
VQGWRPTKSTTGCSVAPDHNLSNCVSILCMLPLLPAREFCSAARRITSSVLQHSCLIWWQLRALRGTLLQSDLQSFMSMQAACGSGLTAVMLPQPWLVGELLSCFALSHAGQRHHYSENASSHLSAAFTLKRCHKYLVLPCPMQQSAMQCTRHSQQPAPAHSSLPTLFCQMDWKHHINSSPKGLGLDVDIFCWQEWVEMGIVPGSEAFGLEARQGRLHMLDAPHNAHPSRQRQLSALHPAPAGPSCFG